MTKRASVFENALDVDVRDFSPKQRSDKEAPTQEQVRAVAEAANFPSRQARDVPAKPTTKRAARVYRTGRNVQFNAKASQETIDAIYAVTEAQPGWVLGYTLERAIAALKRELESES